MPHHGHHGGPRLEIPFLVRRAGETQFHIGLAHPLDIVAMLRGDEFGRVAVDGLRNSGHDPHLHEGAHHVDAAFGHAAGQFLDGNGLGNDHVAYYLLSLARQTGLTFFFSFPRAADRGQATSPFVFIGQGFRNGESSAAAPRFAAPRGQARAPRYRTARSSAAVPVFAFLGFRPDGLELRHRVGGGGLGLLFPALGFLLLGLALGLCISASPGFLLLGLAPKLLFVHHRFRRAIDGRFLDLLVGEHGLRRFHHFSHLCGLGFFGPDRILQGPCPRRLFLVRQAAHGLGGIAKGSDRDPFFAGLALGARANLRHLARIVQGIGTLLAHFHRNDLRSTVREFLANLSALDGLLQFQLAWPGNAQRLAFFLFFDVAHVSVDTVTSL